jgi:hypothetical protein
MSETTNPGHRQRLRDRFMAGTDGSRDEEALLELLLTYAIPIEDVRSLAHDLIQHFGSLTEVLAADEHELCNRPGVKYSTATLLKLVDWLRSHPVTEGPSEREVSEVALPLTQPPLFEPEEPAPEATPVRSEAGRAKARPQKQRTPLFSKAVLAETIEILPRLPETESLDEIKLFLRDNLHYSAAETRQRYAGYVLNRMFPQGQADAALRTFAKKYAGRQELRDACFYRFCKAEPLMFCILDELILPAVGSGRLDRGLIRNYLVQKYPSAGSVTQDCSWAIVEAMVAGGLVRADAKKLYFAYRSIPDSSFAFVLHSEFPEPGMYDIARIEENQAIRALLWNPAGILSALYELRNLGIISKVSQIDSFRQFTTRWDLEQAVAFLVSQGGGA